MTVLLTVAAVLILGCVLILLTSRTVLSLSYQNNQLGGAVLIAGCGIIYGGAEGQFGLACGRFRRYFKPKTGRVPPAAKPQPVSPPRLRRRRPELSTIIATVRALILFSGRMVSRVRVDEARFELRPMIANPALAGIAYGWSRAFYGVFPAVRRTVDVTPGFGDGDSVVSARLVLSVPNRIILLSIWELLRELPIKGLVKYAFSKRGV